jgi:hypothetical protein
MKNRLLIALMAALFLTLSGPAAQNDNPTILLETIGHFSGQTLYLSYISIGTIADGHAKGVYEKSTADELLAKTINLCKGSVDQLNKLLSSGALGGEDIAYVNGLVDTFNLLSAQAGGYRNYIRTGDANHVKVFSSKREAAWKNITELLGITD